MKFTEWLNDIVENGLLCGVYTEKTLSAKSKKQILDLVLDSNGMNFLQEMQMKGHPLPYETITKEFGSYINGRYVAEYTGSKGNKFTSSLYCCFKGSMIVDTTLLSILGCDMEIHIKDNDYVKVCVDSNSTVTIHCPNSSRCITEVFGDAVVHVKGREDCVIIERHYE